MAPKSSNIIDSEVPVLVDSVIYNNPSASDNSVNNADIDLSTYNGSTRITDVVATATIVKGLTNKELLRDAKCLFVPGDAWDSKDSLVSNS